MKASILITLAIIGLTLVFSRQQDKKIQQLRASRTEPTHKRDIPEPSLTQPSPASKERPATTQRSSSAPPPEPAQKHDQTVTREQEIRELTASFGQFVAKVTANVETLSADELEQQKQKFKEFFATFTQEDIKLFFQSLSELEKFTNKQKKTTAIFATREFLPKYQYITYTSGIPESILSKQVALMENRSATFDAMAEDMIGFGKWLLDHSEQASKFIDSQPNRIPSLMINSMREDPDLALDLAVMIKSQSSKPESSLLALETVGTYINLDRFDQFLTTLADKELSAEDRASVMRGFGKHKFLDDFSASQTYLQNEALTAADHRHLIEGMYYWTLRSSIETWMNWLGQEQVQVGQESQHHTQAAQRIMDVWAKQDFQTAGKWINSLPNGDFRDANALAYATALAKDEPEAAAEWAESLPASPQKTKLLELIQRNP